MVGVLDEDVDEDVIGVEDEVVDEVVVVVVEDILGGTVEEVDETLTEDDVDEVVDKGVDVEFEAGDVVGIVEVTDVVETVVVLIGGIVTVVDSVVDVDVIVEDTDGIAFWYILSRRLPPQYSYSIQLMQSLKENCSNLL